MDSTESPFRNLVPTSVSASGGTGCLFPASAKMLNVDGLKDFLPLLEEECLNSASLTASEMELFSWVH